MSASSAPGAEHKEGGAGAGTGSEALSSQQPPPSPWAPLLEVPAAAAAGAIPAPALAAAPGRGMVPAMRSQTMGAHLLQKGQEEGQGQGQGQARAAGSFSHWWPPSARAERSSFADASSSASSSALPNSSSRGIRGLVRAFQATPDDFVLVGGKGASPESLERWRAMTLARNPTRRFRYVATLPLSEQPMRPERDSSSRKASMALAAAQGFSQGSTGDQSSRQAQAEGFGLGAAELELMVSRHDANSLAAFGQAQGVAAALGVEDPARGIVGSAEDLARRERAFGSNTFPEKAEKSFLSFVWDGCQDFTLIILGVCALVSIGVGLLSADGSSWTDGLGILLSIVLVVLVTATSDYRQAQQFTALDKEKKKVFITAIRGGQRQRVSVYSLVVGDVIMLSIGDIVPADGVLLTSSSLVVDESSMTGESQAVQKSVQDSPFLLAGTKVQDGTATYLVTGVGLHTEWGNLLAKLSEEGKEETPLQVRLNGLATLVGRLGLIVAALVFLVLLARLALQASLVPITWADIASKVVAAFAVSVTIVVVAVPEGLPLAVTLSLAFAMKQMMADKALVRKLAACETMGSATTICSDKTGTLTANQMVAVQLWQGGAVTHLALTTELKDRMSPGVESMFLEAIFTNTSGEVQYKSGSQEVEQVLGSPTESALLKLALQMGGNFCQVRSQSECLRVEPFNSARKRMGVLLRLPTAHSPPATPAASLLPSFSSATRLLSPSFGRAAKGDVFRVHWKGAAEMIAKSCTHTLNAAGQIAPSQEESVTPVLHAFSANALRTLGFAFLDLDASALPSAVREGKPWPEDAPLPASGLTLLGFVGIQDPLRPSVPGAVALCKSAGITVRMVTGDNLDTAKAIARECGILTEGGQAMEGPVFRNLTPEQMKAVIPHLQVLARSSPSDKLTLVHELKAMGEVVAVTGDGTNDAPALKESDIGLAMGIAGTEVAKESADIIVLDDNFASIVNVARWGRSVYTNIQKFVQFQLTVNFVALTINFVAAVFTGNVPLTAVQLLWVNLIMDTLGALALATEPPTDDLMKHTPVGRHAPFVTNIMWRNLLGQALFQLILLSLLPWLGEPLFGISAGTREQEKCLDTIIFNTFVYCQVFNEINSRQMEKLNVFAGFFRNSLFLAIIAFTALFQVVLVQGLCSFVGTVQLSAAQFLTCIGLAALGLPVAALVKLIPVPRQEMSPALLLRLFSKPKPRDNCEPLLENGACAQVSS